jgi:hypothetical protein
VSGNPSYGVLAMDLGHTLHGSAVFEGVVYLDTAGARPSERAHACAVGELREGWLTRERARRVVGQLKPYRGARVMSAATRTAV